MSTTTILKHRPHIQLPKRRNGRARPHTGSAEGQPEPTVTAERRQQMRKNTFAVATVGAAVFGVYVATLAPGVTAGDGGELITAAWTQGVAHPPGYPLWCLGAWLFGHLVPIGSVAYRMNLFTALFGALASSTCAATVLWLGCRRTAAILAGLCLGLSEELWAQSVQAEVYSLNLFFVGLLLHVLLKWQADRRPGRLVLFAGLLGLGLGNHHTLLAIGVVGAVWVIWHAPRVLLQGKLWAKALAALCAGLLVYVYLPLAASTNSAMNWGNPRTPQAFWRHLSRAQYPSDLEKPRSLVRTVGQFGFVTGQAIEQFTPLLVPIILLGLLRSRRHQGLASLTGMVFLAFMAGFTLLSNFEFQRENLEVIRVFYLPVYYVMAVWLGLGLEELFALARRAADGFGFSSDLVVAYGSLALLPALLLWSLGPENDCSAYYFAEDHARNVLATLEKHAIVFPSGDHNTFPLIYLIAVEHQRSDVTIADKYGYVEKYLYQHMPNPPAGQPSATERQSIEDWIIRNTERPVYFTVKRSMAGLEGYSLQQAGLLYRVVRPGETFEPGHLWQRYRYRHFSRGGGAIDYGADQILFDYYFQRGMWHLDHGQKRHALEAFAQAERHGQWIRESYNNIASALAEHGLTQDALGLYRRALAIDPRYPNARWNLARLYQGSGRIGEAIEEYRQLAKYDPKDPRPFGQIGFLYRAIGQMDQAVVYWNKSLERQPDQRQILDALAEAHAATSSTDPASLPNVSGTKERAGDTQPSSSKPPVPPPPKGPHLKLGATEHDFGTIVEGNTPSFDFVLENVGLEPLKLSDLETTCACTAALPEDSTIEPGQKTHVTVSLKTQGRVGQQRQKITIRTNDPDTATLTLWVHAMVLAQLELTPRTVQLDRVRPARVFGNVAQLICRGGSDFEVLDVAVEPPVATAELHKPREPAETLAYRLDLRFADRLRGGPLRAKVRITTTHPRYRRLELNLAGYVAELVDCKPRRAFFGTVQSKNAGEARVTVDVSCKAVPELQARATPTSPYVCVDVEPTDDPQLVKLVVSLKDDLPPGFLSASLELLTNVREMPEVTVPVSALIR